MCRRIGCLDPEGGKDPKYAQLYLFDTDARKCAECGRNPTLYDQRFYPIFTTCSGSAIHLQLYFLTALLECGHPGTMRLG